MEVNSLSIIENTDMTSFKQTMSKIGQFQRLVRENLQDGKDYGTIPGTYKPTLYKPGAEKILMLMGLQSTYEILDSTRDFKEGFFQYQVRCTLKKNEMIITQGLGACNSKEKKYERQSGFNIDNTILKMAKKRSQVDASLTVASLSEIFTQDLEDTGVDIEGDNGGNHYSKPTNNDLASQKQIDLIYGNVICEECGTRVYGFKCPKCKNNKDLHYNPKGIIHSHHLKKEDFSKTGKMTPALLIGKLTKQQASELIGWWIGDSEKFVIGERLKREKIEKETKPKKTTDKLEIKDKDAPFPVEDEVLEAGDMPDLL